MDVEQNRERCGMVRYKIGELSAMLGIPVETLRYYEQKGLVKPIKERNGYRSFGMEDFFRLLIVKSLRGFDFSLNEIINTVNEPDPMRRINLMEEKQRQYLEVIESYQQLVQHAQKYINAIRSVQENLWKCRIEESPAKYAYTVIDNQYIYSADSERHELNKQWLERAPYWQIAFDFKKESMINHKKSNPFRWGLAIDVEDAERLQLEMDEGVRYWPPRKSIYTVFAIRQGGRPFDKLGYLFEYIEKNNLKIAGDVLGSMIYQSYYSKEPLGYFHMCVPIE